MHLNRWIPSPARQASLLLLLCLLSAGTGKPSILAETASEARERPFTILMPRGEITYDPHHAYTTTEAQIFTGLYEGLVSYHPITLEPAPAVAETWTVSEDKTVYTFTLREEARFHNGDPLRASHFRRSWLRILDPGEKAEYASLLDIIKNAAPYRRGEISSREEVGIRTPTPQTLEITLEHPAPHFLRILCHHAFSPLHPSYLSGDRAFTGQNFLGNGPFTLAEASEENLRLTRSPQYWDRDRVALKEILIRRLDDPTRATRLFNTDQADWITSTIDFDILNRRKSVAVNNLFATSYYFFQTGGGAGTSAEVRQALLSLTTWEDFRKDQLLPADTLVPPIPRYPKAEGFTSLPREEALSLLQQADVPARSGENPLIIAVPKGSPDLSMAEQIQADWEKAGVSAVIREHPFPEYYQVLKDGDYTLGTVSWIGDFADPLTFLQMWTSTSNLNDSRLNSPEYDQLLRDSMGKSFQERYKLLSQAEQLLLETAVVLPLSHSPAINLIDLQFVGGWHSNFLDIHPLKYLEFLNTLPIPGVI